MKTDDLIRTLAADPPGQTLWQARWQYVRIVPSDGAAPNRHPARLAKAEIRSGLALVRRVEGDGEAADFLTPEERAFYADQVGSALAKAGPGQDVVVATVGMRKTLLGLAEQRLTTARVFVTDEGLNVVVGESLIDVPNDSGTYTKVDPRLVSFADGRRSGPVHGGQSWALTAAGAGVVAKRPDWVVIQAAAMATPEPGTQEAQTQMQQQVQDLRQQVQQHRTLRRGRC